jgi:transketolase N-terminal domain/subunit
MKKWQSILEQHHNVEIISDSQVKVLDVIYHLESKITRDDMITRIKNGYTDSEGHNYQSIYDYLGY